MQYQPSNAQLNEYYQQEAQLQYQQQAMQTAMGFQALPRYTATYTFRDSVRNLLDSSHSVAPGQYRTHAAYRGAAGQAMTERVAQSAAAVGGIVGVTALTEGLFLGGMKVGGIVGGLAAPMAAGYMLDKASGYLGVNQAFSQLSRINDMQIASHEFMGGIYSRDPFGRRMGRQGARQMNDFIEDYARTVSNYTHSNISSDDLRSNLSKFSQSKLIENVSGPDDLARKFTKLMDTVTKISETLGKSFDQGVEMLAQMRQVNIDPYNSRQVLDSVRRMGTQAGLDFDTTFAGGMQGALAGRQYGLGPAAGMMIGAKAAADSSILYQTGAISGDLLFRLGGEEGMRQRMMQNMLGAGSSQMAELSLVSSFANGKMDYGRLYGFAQGDNAILDDFQFDGGVADLMEFKAQRGKVVSRMNEENPLMMQTLAFRQLQEVAQSTGETFQSEAGMLQMMAELSGGQFNRDDLKLILEQIRGWREGSERARREDRMTGLGRYEDLSERGLFGAVGERFRASGLYGDFVDAGMGITDSIRGGTFNFLENINRNLRYMTTGVYDPGISNYGVRVRGEDGEGIMADSSVYFQDGIFREDAVDMLVRLGDDMGLSRSKVRFGDRVDVHAGKNAAGTYRNAGYNEDTGRFRSATVEWWRERLKETNEGLSEEEKLAEDAFDRFAGREVSMRDVGLEAGLMIYDDATRGTLVSRRDSVEGLMSGVRERADFFAKVKGIDPSDFTRTGRHYEAASTVLQEFNTTFNRAAQRDIGVNELTAGPRLAQALMPMIQEATAGMSDLERRETTAMILEDLGANNPILKVALENTESEYGLGLTKMDVQSAGERISMGKDLFIERFKDADQTLNATRGRSFSSLSSVQRGAMDQDEVASARAKLQRLEESLDDGGFLALSTGHYRYTQELAKGLTHEEALNKVLEDKDFQRFYEANKASMTPQQMFDLYEEMAGPDIGAAIKAADLDNAFLNPWGRNRRQDMVTHFDHLNSVYAEFQASDKTLTEFLEDGNTSSVFANDDIRNDFMKVRAVLEGQTTSGYLSAAVSLQADPGEATVDLARDETLTGTDQTRDEMMQSFLSSIQADIALLVRQQIETNQALVARLPSN